MCHCFADSQPNSDFDSIEGFRIHRNLYNNSYFAQPRQERGTLTILISAIWALGGGISSTNTIGLRSPSLPLPQSHPSNMNLVLNDHGWLVITSDRFHSYVAVASFTAVVYDWALTFGREVELVWRQRWTLITILYLAVRYAGMPYVVMFMLGSLPSVPLTDLVRNIMFVVLNCMNVVVYGMLGVIMITRLHAMYQGSRRMLIFLIVILFVLTMAGGAITTIGINRTNSKAVSGIHQCTYKHAGDVRLLMSITWILRIIWEVLVMCLVVWIVVKHFRQLRLSSQAAIIGDCFMILMKTHVVYFASFVAGSWIALGYYFSTVSDSKTMGYNGALNIFSVVQMFVLGPRLILNVRGYHAKLIAESDTRTRIPPPNTSQELSTSGHV
ncbi:uncharacterized protein EDB93DRAFT_430292 [Suillus bovinus]|uniref:uncharacterized protein n=1 Tax=Suillus bovinus TaxID=48563 RepID=UPI001B874EBC|nr:uncharacterized protein EDB93DRAFT_430292 [Suillus bovinus]KAG2158901.1 hypothetical protein EDB93DRAFT_430292 [Suillus bovinus]